MKSQRRKFVHCKSDFFRELTAENDFSENGSLIASCTVETGESYFLYCEDLEGVRSFTVIKRSQDRDTGEVLSLQTEEGTVYRSICADAAGNVMLGDSTTLYIFKKGTGELSQSFQAWIQGGLLLTDDNAVICQTYKDSPYYVFDLTTGVNRGIFLEKDFLFAKGSCQPFLCGTYGNELLLASGGIYRHIGEEWELQVSAEGTSMAKSGFMAVKIEQRDDGTYAVCDADYQYVYSLKEADDEEGEEQITLRVTAWQDRATLRNALTQYQIDHPNVTIEYTFRCTELPETEQEANILLQQTNAEIVSSQAADLYVLDHLPWEQYQEKGLLMDISEIVRPYAEDEDYFGNILKAYETEEGIYAVPWFFTAKFVICREELVPYVNGIHDLAGYLEDHPEDMGVVPYYYRDRPQVFLAMMYDFYESDLYDEGVITLENVESFLRSAKIIYDRQQENAAASVLPDYAKDSFDYSFMQENACRDDLVLFYTEQEGSFMPRMTPAFGVHFLVQPFYYQGSALVPMDEFHSQFLFGIHSQSEEKEAAADLLRYLLSYYKEVGDADESIKYEFDTLPGIPIYKSCLRQSFEKRYGAEDIPMAEGYPMYVATPEDTEKLIALLDGYYIPTYTADAATNDAYAIFQERSIAYLTGEKTLEVVSDEVYNGLQLLYEEKR